MSLQISLRNVPEEVWLGQWAVRSAVLLATALSFPEWSYLLPPRH